MACFSLREAHPDWDENKISDSAWHYACLRSLIHPDDARAITRLPLSARDRRKLAHDSQWLSANMRYENPEMTRKESYQRAFAEVCRDMLIDPDIARAAAGIDFDLEHWKRQGGRK